MDAQESKTTLPEPHPFSRTKGQKKAARKLRKAAIVPGSEPVKSESELAKTVESTTYIKSRSEPFTAVETKNV